MNGKKRESNTHKEIDVKQIKHLEANIVGYAPYWKKQKIKNNTGGIVEVMSPLIIDYRIDSINNLYLRINEISKNLFEKFSAIEGKSLVIYHQISREKIAEYIAFNSFPEDEKYMKVIEEEKQTIIKEFGYVPKEIKKMIQQDIFVNVVIDML